MVTKEIVSKLDYTDLIGHISSMFKLPILQIKQKYADYPICLMEYFEKEVYEESIEIRFDKEEVTLTCIFNDNKECILVFLFPDEEQFIEDMVSYLSSNYGYSYLKSRFILDSCFVKVKEPKTLKDCTYLVFYQ